jgi:2-phospho-L-lactate guanylyltransferase
MNLSHKTCAVVPIKETGEAKQRLAAMLSAAQRRALALAMAEDVLAALAQVRELTEIVVVTVDPGAAAIGRRFGARISPEDARAGHTGAVAGAARRLARDGVAMLALPADIPLLAADDIRQLLAAHRPAPAFTIVPAHDELGSNAVLCSPADAVPLRFGDNSFFPHLAAARACGLEPQVVHLPRIALDIDTPDDLARFLSIPSRTGTRAMLDGWKIAAGGLPSIEKAGA